MDEDSVALATNAPFAAEHWTIMRDFASEASGHFRRMIEAALSLIAPDFITPADSANVTMTALGTTGPSTITLECNHAPARTLADCQTAAGSSRPGTSATSTMSAVVTSLSPMASTSTATWLCTNSREVNAGSVATSPLTRSDSTLITTTQLVRSAAFCAARPPARAVATPVSAPLWRVPIPFVGPQNGSRTRVRARCPPQPKMLRWESSMVAEASTDLVRTPASRRWRRWTRTGPRCQRWRRSGQSSNRS